MTRYNDGVATLFQNLDVNARLPKSWIAPLVCIWVLCQALHMALREEKGSPLDTP